MQTNQSNSDFNPQSGKAMTEDVDPKSQQNFPGGDDDDIDEEDDDFEQDDVDETGPVTEAADGTVSLDESGLEVDDEEDFDEDDEE